MPRIFDDSEFTGAQGMDSDTSGIAYSDDRYDEFDDNAFDRSIDQSIRQASRDADNSFAWPTVSTGRQRVPSSGTSKRGTANNADQADDKSNGRGSAGRPPKSRIFGDDLAKLSEIRNADGPVARLGGSIVFEAYISGDIRFSAIGDATVTFKVPTAYTDEIKKLVDLYGYVFRVVVKEA